MSDGIQIKKSDNLTMFVPMFVDDYGFTPEEFRIFARIMRRAYSDKSHGCSESIPNMAKALNISERLVRRSLKVLEACRAISREMRPGCSDLLDFNPCDEWAASEQLPTIRAAIDETFKAADRARKEARQPLAETQTLGGNATTPLAETQPVPLAETQGKGKQVRVKKEGTADASPVGEVFEFYKEHLNHPKSKLTKEKRDKITHRLKEGYTVEELKDAIRGCKSSPHHMGVNDSGTVYDSVDLIFRSGSKVEQFIGYLNKAKPKEEEALVFVPNNSRLPYETWVECAFIKSPPEEKILMYPKVRADYLMQWPNTEAEINEYEQTAEYRENYAGTGQIGNGIFAPAGRGTAQTQSKVPVSH